MTFRNRALRTGSIAARDWAAAQMPAGESASRPSDMAPWERLPEGQQVAAVGGDLKP